MVYELQLDNLKIISLLPLMFRLILKLLYNNYPYYYSLLLYVTIVMSVEKGDQLLCCRVDVMCRLLYIVL
jgi:hypothetical protein